jgi:hypothetical protein
LWEKNKEKLLETEKSSDKNQRKLMKIDNKIKINSQIQSFHKTPPNLNSTSQISDRSKTTFTPFPALPPENKQPCTENLDFSMSSGSV